MNEEEPGRSEMSGFTQEEMSFRELLGKALGQTDPLPPSDLHLLSGMMPEESRIFMEWWSLASVERRQQLLQSLVELAESNFEMDFGAVFKHCLDDEDEEVRRTAVEGLWEDESPSLVKPLAKMLLEDPSVVVREAAAISLGRFAYLAEMGELDAQRSATISEALSTVVHNSREYLGVRRRTIESIAHMSVDNLRQIIDAAYGDENRLMRISALFAMGRSADIFWRGTVISELSNDDPGFRSEAARACGELMARVAVPVLSRLIEDRDEEVQRAAIWALGQIGGEQAREILFTCCESDDDLIRESSEEALAEWEIGTTSLDMLTCELDDDLMMPEEGFDWDLEA